MLEVCRRVAGWAADGEQVEAYGAHSHRARISARDGQVESVSTVEARGIGLRVVVGGRLGFASTSDLSDGGLAQVLREARANAAYGTQDEATGLPQPTTPTTEGGVPLRTSVQDKMRLALGVDRLVREVLPGFGFSSVSVSDQVAEVGIASSTGVATRFGVGSAEAELIVYAEHERGVAAVLGYTAGVSCADLDAEGIVAMAAGRARAQARRGASATGRVRLVLDPLVTAELLDYVGRALCGDEIARGRSAYADEPTGPLAAAGVVVVDDPLEVPSGFRRTSDDEGVPTQRTVLIADQQLRGVLHSTRSAAATGATSTGNAGRVGHRSLPQVRPMVLRLEGPAPPADIGDAVLVHELLGLHTGADPVTGRIGADVAGVWLRGGEEAEPVRDTSMSCSFAELLGAVRGVGADERFYPLTGWTVGSTTTLEGLTLDGPQP